MRLNHWLKSFFAVPPRRRTRAAVSAAEVLEDRILLATWTWDDNDSTKVFYNWENSGKTSKFYH